MKLDRTRQITNFPYVQTREFPCLVAGNNTDFNLFRSRQCIDVPGPNQIATPGAGVTSQPIVQNKPEDGTVQRSNTAIDPATARVRPETPPPAQSSSPLSSLHLSSQPDPVVDCASSSGANLEKLNELLQTPKPAQGLARKFPVNAYPPINASKFFRAAAHTYTRGPSPSPSESSEGENHLTEYPQQRQRKDMFGTFLQLPQTTSLLQPRNPGHTSAQNEGRQLLRDPQDADASRSADPDDSSVPVNSRASSAPETPTMSFVDAAKARASSAPETCRPTALSNSTDSGLTEVGKDLSAGLEVPTRRRDGMGRIMPVGSSMRAVPSLPHQDAQSQMFGDGFLSRPSITVNSPRDDGNSTPGPSRTEPRSRSSPRISGALESHDEHTLDGAISMDEFESVDDFEPLHEEDDVQPQRPFTHRETGSRESTGSPPPATRAQKGKAPLRNVDTRSLHQPHGRPAVSVNEELERVGHRMQAELVELAKTHDLSYKTLLRKVGFAGQQETRLPNLANMFRKVHKHRLIANKERKEFHCKLISRR